MFKSLILLEPRLNPQTIMFNFEKAVQIYFPNTLVRSCHFHMA